VFSVVIPVRRRSESVLVGCGMSSVQIPVVTAKLIGCADRNCAVRCALLSTKFCRKSKQQPRNAKLLSACAVEDTSA